MGVLFAGGEAAGTAGLEAALAGALTPAGALAFLVVQILFIPCVATVAAMRQETRSWGWTALGVGLLLAISMVGGIVAYQAAMAF